MKKISLTGLQNERHVILYCVFIILPSIVLSTWIALTWAIVPVATIYLDIAKQISRGIIEDSFTPLGYSALIAAANDEEIYFKVRIIQLLSFLCVVGGSLTMIIKSRQAAKVRRHNVSSASTWLALICMFFYVIIYTICWESSELLIRKSLFFLWP